MRIATYIGLALAAGVLAGCEGTRGGQDLSVDAGLDRKGLERLQAGIWVDPNGCQHWIIDDGVEGYLSQRLTPSGKPVCDPNLPRATVIGDHKSGSGIADIF